LSDDEAGRTFLSRWSRRKIAARQAEAEPQIAAAATPQPAPEAAGLREGEPVQPQPLPDPETLEGLRSEYREFLQPGVDESVRRVALKKLFADPHFNVMDGLDVYIDDYSKPDPIPAALLRSLNQARGLRLFDDEDEAARGEADGATQQIAAVTADGPVAALPADDPGNVTDCREETEGPEIGSGEASGDRKNGQSSSV
jgi:hypothetical protein